MIYYTIDEGAARRAKNANSFFLTMCPDLQRPATSRKWMRPH